MIAGSTVQDYYVNGHTTNWTMWTFIFLMMLFFLIFAFANEDMDMRFHKEERWSHHPVYSITYMTSGMFTKLNRLTILFVVIVSELLFLSLFNRFFSDTHLAIKLTLFPLGAVAWSLIPEYVSAFFLQKLYGTFKIFIGDMKRYENYDDRLRARETWEKTSF